MIASVTPRTPPTIETSRLLLRGWRRQDFRPHAEMSADPEVMRYLGRGRTLSQAQTSMEIAVHFAHWGLRGYGQWALERKQDGASIGRAGLWNPPGWPGTEVGWKLTREAWGQGYATEAGQAAIDWTWRSIDVPKLISLIQPENAASIRVAERLGMRHARDSVLKGQQIVIYELTRPSSLG